MEERVSSQLSPPPPVVQSPPQDPSIQNHSSKALQLSPNLDPGTYVVRVPKDQVYRVPPPENAEIAELHRSTPQKNTKRTRCWCVTCFIVVIIVILIIIGGILGGLFSVVLKPKDPRFSIQHFNVLKGTPKPKYNITLQAHNPNSKVGIWYKEGGHVSLSLRPKEIASGSYPSFHQTPHDSTPFGVTLKASKAGFPKEVEESITNHKHKVHVAFSLTIHVPARMKMGLLRSGTMQFDVTCQVTLDSLAKTPRVLSQQCQTKRH
ncbi:hypothetical protein VNO77_10428 [Canavalia gladiata]|uniref:Late embryogenesis abundant protein LEA-2 subgroup domain-containing protein n=1 Tax=Canavalia gladiata TaxID=3824 RepID=A0AAN9ME27_CANGL